MDLFSIDKNKCRRDGICAAECPIGLIEMEDKDSFPSPVEGAVDLCIDCGHCVAVCPHGALSLKTMSPGDCAPVKNDAAPGIEEIQRILRTRRSIRTFKENPVEKGLLEKLIESANHAPSGRNTQPVRWLVVYDRNELDALEGMVIEWMRYMAVEQKDFASMMNFQYIISLREAGRNTPVINNAPHMIIAYASKDSVTSQDACIIAMTHLDIAAPSFGLGTCWAGYFNAAARFWPSMQKALRLPDGYLPYCSMVVGYPEYTYRRIPVRHKSRISWR